MLFHINHTTTYNYSRPVALDPHTLRLRPRHDGSQILKHFALDIFPSPAGLTEFTDLEGNAASQVWFADMTQSLRISIMTEVETLRENPFDYVLSEPGMMTLPVRYPESARNNLTAYCQPLHRDGPVAWYAEELAAGMGGDTLRFLTALSHDLYDRMEIVVRPSGEPQSAEQTLKSEQGAGRDVAVLFVEACRTQGIAARFTSGYWNGYAPDGKQYLHAWAEVYFPQSGWRGYDPTVGLAAADHHVSVAAGLYPGSAASITGAFWGSDVQSNMEVAVHVRAQ
ncbi:MAG TPA: transglutaminase family protein [Kiritimatiellia bacterium]|nr:transglutaminase family protein [Kiritimatiellia bacterium]HMO98305.1 transglutaminase family protein [Kiritimatiellia bacterium]HMP95499.1 transglutaminase family protein [Kiritimatiellia bacterium]